MSEFMDMIRVKSLQPGESFGELALINNRPRLASLISDTFTHVAILRKNEYNKILKRSEESKILKEMGFFA